MHTGVVFPQTEATTNQLEIKEYALTAEELGYNHILAYDHILGANAGSRPGWSGAYKHTDTFYEPLILFSFEYGSIGFRLISPVLDFLRNSFFFFLE